MVRAGRITAAVVLPFLTGVSIDVGTQSDVQKMSADEMTRFLMLRTAFFAEPERQAHFDLAHLGQKESGPP